MQTYIRASSPIRQNHKNKKASLLCTIPPKSVTKDERRTVHDRDAFFAMLDRMVGICYNKAVKVECWNEILVSYESRKERTLFYVTNSICS